MKRGKRGHAPRILKDNAMPSPKIQGSDKLVKDRKVLKDQYLTLYVELVYLHASNNG